MNGTSCHELDETDADARAHMGHGLDEEYDIEDESVGFEDSYNGECALRPEEDASDSGGRPAEPGSFVSRQSVGGTLKTASSAPSAIGFLCLLWARRHPVHVSCGPLDRPRRLLRSAPSTGSSLLRGPTPSPPPA
jgi:hypothetical protein